LLICNFKDVGLNKNGAYTGEVSAAMLYDAGVRWTLTGHSERRVGFGFPGETNEVVGAKTAIAVKSGLQVIACIGEQLADRESGKTMQICAAQLAAIASCLTIEEWKKVVIAYEPVWAIGTGKVATPEQAEDTHKDIRKWLYDNVSPEVANYVRILYGGSVKGSNCVDLICCPNIDGFLVGGASLLPEFVDIIKVRARSRFVILRSHDFFFSAQKVAFKSVIICCRNKLFTVYCIFGTRSVMK
jgi:triosephosphate isomerase